MDVIAVSPRESTEVLVNPGMGWTTFGSFNGDEKNRNYPRSSIAYFRLYWDQLEPEEGQYRWDVIDDIIAKARQNGQDVALRVSTMNGVVTAGAADLKRAGLVLRNYRVPDWYRHSGAKGMDFLGRGNPAADAVPVWEPDYGDPLYLEKHGRFIAALGSRYDGHPNLDHMDLGSFGRWGEWHCAVVPKPPIEKRLQIVDTYLAAFRKTPLLMLVADQEAMAHAIRNGTGWRADCMGDSRQGVFNPDWQGGTEDFNHLDDIYLQRLVGAKATKAWKRAPVAFETCWDMKYWYAQGWNVDHIFAYALALHGSVMNNKSSPVPEEWWPQVDDFSRKMGYRFVLRKIEYPDRVAPGGVLPIGMVWDNRGVAPCYRKVALAFRLQSQPGGASVVLPAQADVGRWLPGRFNVEEALALPATTPRGACQLSVGIVDPATLQPKVRLAIEGRDPDGWYPIGERIKIA